MSSIVITGVNGFVGHHMAAELGNAGHEVIGIGRESSSSIASLDGYFACDLTKSDEVDALSPQLEKAAAVIHLAGIATTNNSPEQAAIVLALNVDVHRVLYDTLLQIGSKARVIAVSTGLVYETHQPVPYTEASALLPDDDTTNPYVRSKLRVEKIANEYAGKGLDIVVARPFNHTGPGQGPGFFVPDKLAQIRQAMQNGVSLELGDTLDFWRDFTDVRDVVKAYGLLATAGAEQLTEAIYNISSGVSVWGSDLFKLLAAELGYSGYSIAESEPSASNPRIAGDASKLRKNTGWRPDTALKDTVHDLVATEK